MVKIELLSKESKNVVHSIETELESLLYANFPADLVTERNRLEKAGEKIKQILEKRWKNKSKKFTGLNKNSSTRTLAYSNRFKFVNWKRKGNFDSQSELNQETEAAIKLEPTKSDYNVSQNVYQRAFLAKMHIIAAIHYWLITLLILTKC